MIFPQKIKPKFFKNMCNTHQSLGRGGACPDAVKDGEVIARIAACVPEEIYNFPKLPDETSFKSLPDRFQEVINQIWFSAMCDPGTFPKFSAVFIDGKKFYL